MHPPNTKAARGIAGLKFQLGRTLFALDDSRLAELRIPGLDAPETEGWKAKYCTEERGPMHCIAGTFSSRVVKTSEEYSIPDNWININFRQRVMQEGASFFYNNR
ncbi:hypothetical protein CRYUN_Cryun03dG0116900 [Craigia yunnanensis]